MRTMIFLLFCGTAFGQTATPVVARQRETQIRIEADGSESVVNETRGIFLRSSSGRTLTRKLRGPRGQEVLVDDAVLIDPASNTVYSLSYSAKAAKPGQRSFSPPTTPEYIAQAKQHAIGELTINGIHCYLFPVVNGSNGMQQIGSACRSLEHNLTIRSEKTFDRGGFKYKVVTEMYDIQLGKEPPIEDVSIPKEFSITDKSDR